MSNDNISYQRMLLSHNFDLQDDRLSRLSREEFTAIFSNGFDRDSAIECRQVNNPHWIVSIKFPATEYSPQLIGSKCAEFLRQQRQQTIGDRQLPDILILGGIKSTPSTNPSSDSLQPNEWGVDVVETNSSQEFLNRIGWEATIASKDPDTIFQVVLEGV
jgi:hypothetical protein